MPNLIVETKDFLYLFPYLFSSLTQTHPVDKTNDCRLIMSQLIHLFLGDIHFHNRVVGKIQDFVQLRFMHASSLIGCGGESWPIRIEAKWGSRLLGNMWTYKGTWGHLGAYGGISA